MHNRGNRHDKAQQAILRAETYRRCIDRGSVEIASTREFINITVVIAKHPSVSRPPTRFVARARDNFRDGLPLSSRASSSPSSTFEATKGTSGGYSIRQFTAVSKIASNSTSCEGGTLTVRAKEFTLPPNDHSPSHKSNIEPKSHIYSKSFG